MPCNVDRVDVAGGNDSIRCFSTLDGVQFIYLLSGPLYLFCVSRSGESIVQIRDQLRFCHLLIVMTLTNVFEKTLAQSPQFDLRSIFGPTDYMMLRKLVEDEDRSPRYLFASFCPFRIDSAHRDLIGAALVRSKKEMAADPAPSAEAKSNANGSGGGDGGDGDDDRSWRRKLLYGVLLVRGRVVSCAAPKKKALSLHHEDLILLGHFVRNSQSWKQSEAFTPICLPHFEASGFVYCYVSYLRFQSIADGQRHDDDDSRRSDVCFIAITLNSASFKRCQSLRKRIELQLLRQSPLGDSILNKHGGAGFGGELTTKAVMAEVFGDDDANGGDMKRPQVFAFYFNDIRRHQFVAPRPIKLYDTEHGEKALFRRLQQLQHHSHSTPRHPLYFQRTATDAAVCRLEEGHYEIYVILNPLCSKTDALDVLNKLTEWVLRNQKDLFMTQVHW